MSDNICPGCGTDHSEMDALTGGPDPEVLIEAIDTFRALTTLRIGQVSDGDGDVDPERLIAAMKPVEEIATVIMFLRHSIRQTDTPEDAEEHAAMIGMLRAVEVMTAVSTMGPMLFADQIMAMYDREWTPREKFSARWSDEITRHIPPLNTDTE